MVIHVIGNTLPQAYHKALSYLGVYGEEKYNKAWGQKRREMPAVIEIVHPLEEPRISKLGIFGARDLRKYELELLDGIEDFELEAGNWTYTYHDRLAEQIGTAIKILKEDNGSTRAIITIRNEKDISMSDSPCMVSIQYMINEGKLDSYVSFRSNDLVEASFMNMWGLIKLQERVAKELSIPVGKYIHYCPSLHCYEKDFRMLKHYIDRISRYGEENDDLCFFYEGDWKDEMDDEEDGIREEIEELRRRTVEQHHAEE